MTRTVTRIAAVAVVLFLCGCSGYHTIAKPWNIKPTNSEFDSTHVVRAGNRVRLTTVDEQVSEGIFVEMDEYAITLADTIGDVKLVTVPIEAIYRLEVYGGVSGKTLGTVAAVAVTSAIIYAIIDSESGPTFSPDDATTAKVVGR